MLIRALCAATGGFHWEAFEGSTADQLSDLGRQLGARMGLPTALHLESWDAALAVLGTLGGDRPTVVALDELPYALQESPEITSLLQRRLAVDRTSRTRWILCGSAVRVMGRLLAGEAPLRGRAGLELVVRPFDYRLARTFWGLEDLSLAARVFAIVGGTPAYAREFIRSDAPDGPADFDAWVCRTVLDPSVPLFREARILLAEEEGIVDRALYSAILGAVAAGDNAPSRIAARIGRPVTALAHALGVLCDTGLIARHGDAFHPRRATYEIAEPLLRFHHAILRPAWSVLEHPGRQREVWSAASATFATRVVGPVFEEICRTWTLRFAPPARVGGAVAWVGRGVVSDPAGRARHELDVVARDTEGRIIAIGEAKWGAVGERDAQRLRAIATLLGDRIAPDARLLLFTGGRRTALGAGVDAIDLATLYA